MKSKKIMIVEDEPLTMLFVKETLEDYDYEDILEYSSGQAIIDSIKQGIIPNMILMDINIKGAKDGIQTATEILQLCTVPIIFMSAYNDKRTIKEVLAVSTYGFLSKPFNKRELYIMLEFAWKNFDSQNNAKKQEEKKRVELYENCYYNLETKLIYLNNNLMILSHNEQVLLDTLVKNLNSIVSRDALVYTIWDREEESTSVLRNIVYLLRKKLKGIHISAQSKHGYILKATYV